MKYALGTVNLARSAGTATAQLHKRLGICPDETDAGIVAAKAVAGAGGRFRKKLQGIFVRAYDSVFTLD